MKRVKKIISKSSDSEVKVTVEINTKYLTRDEINSLTSQLTSRLMSSIPGRFHYTEISDMKVK